MSRFVCHLLQVGGIDLRDDRQGLGLSRVGEIGRSWVLFARGSSVGACGTLDATRLE